MPLLNWRKRILLAPGGEAYLLRDDFTDILAAGAVNGTPATPGPGTRTVTDAGLNLSVGSGVVTLAAGTCNSRYGVQTRLAGRLVVARTNVTTAANSYSGFAVSTGASAVAWIYEWLATNLYVAWFGGQVAIGSYAAGWNPYAVVMRASGAFYFAYQANAWKLLYLHGVSSVDGYPCLSNLNSNFGCDFIRVPFTTWLPVPIASDSFTRADGALGSTDGIGHAEANGGGSLAWTAELGTWGISSNTAVSSELDVSGIGIATVPCGTANVVGRVIATRAGNEIGMCLRYVDADNYLLVQHDGTNCQLVERASGVNATRITAAAALGAGEIKCSLDGANARLYLNDVLIGSYATLANTTATAHGIFTTNIGNALDSFVIWARGNGGQYSILDRWISP